MVALRAISSQGRRVGLFASRELEAFVISDQ
jgi:hypothetical protein